MDVILPTYASPTTSQFELGLSGAGTHVITDLKKWKSRDFPTWNLPKGSQREGSRADDDGREGGAFKHSASHSTAI